ncbi:MAG: ferritin [Armatimonadota bacterium]
MISKTLGTLLEAQVGNELQASNMYLAIAVWFGQQSLDKWAAFFFRQSEEEREHAMKIIRFLIDVDYPFSIAAVGASKANYKDAKAAVGAAMKNEQAVTGQFKKMADACMKEKDFTAFQFIQWFIEEQVEEEATMKKLLDILGSVSSAREAELHLPSGE